MKKQILFLLTVLLAIAVSNKSYGQNNEPNYLDVSPTFCTPALPLTCTVSDDPLRPLPGKTYNYSITASSASYVLWFVTNDLNVIASSGTLTSTRDADGGGGSFILDAEDGVYNSITNTATDIDISWKSFNGLTNNVLLVAYAMDAAGCTDNIQVYKIEPSFAFTLDIAGLLDDGTSGNTECVSPVVSATYSPGSPGNLTMDYGANWVFYTVNAANWVHSWLPSFTSGTSGSSALGSVEWAYPDEASGSTSLWHPATDPVMANHYGLSAIDNLGKCIVLRVQADHNNNENLANEVITVGVNGVMYDPAATSGNEYSNNSLRDLDNGSSGCVQDKTDEATYTLTLRPTISSTTVTTGTFVPKN